jgi:hypothetical protein
MINDDLTIPILKEMSLLLVLPCPVMMWLERFEDGGSMLF